MGDQPICGMCGRTVSPAEAEDRGGTEIVCAPCDQSYDPPKVWVEYENPDGDPRFPDTDLVNDEVSDGIAFSDMTAIRAAMAAASAVLAAVPRGPMIPMVASPDQTTSLGEPMAVCPKCGSDDIGIVALEFTAYKGVEVATNGDLHGDWSDEDSWMVYWWPNCRSCWTMLGPPPSS